MIEIEETKVEKMSSLLQSMLTAGGKLMTCLEGMCDEYEDDDDDEDSDYDSETSRNRSRTARSRQKFHTRY